MTRLKFRKKWQNGTAEGGNKQKILTRKREGKIKLNHRTNEEEHGEESKTLGEYVFNFSIIQMLQVNCSECVCKKVKTVSRNIYGTVQRSWQAGGNCI